MKHVKNEIFGDPSKKKAAKSNLNRSNSSNSVAGDESLYSIEDEEDNDIDLILETRISNSLFSQLIASEFCSLFFATLGLMLSIIMYEIREIKLKDSFLVSMTLTLNMICTCFLIFSIYIRYDLWLKWSITIQRYTKYDNLINTGIWK